VDIIYRIRERSTEENHKVVDIIYRIRGHSTEENHKIVDITYAIVDIGYIVNVHVLWT